MDAVLAGLGALLIALAVVVPLSRGGAEPAAPAAPAAAGATGDTVTIKGFKFGPPDLTVKAGTTVTFVNDDTAGHTASAPSGEFDTGGIDRGERKTVTLDKPGTYMYICEFHPIMKAKVTVK